MTFDEQREQRERLARAMQEEVEKVRLYVHGDEDERDRADRLYVVFAGVMAVLLAIGALVAAAMIFNGEAAGAPAPRFRPDRHVATLPITARMHFGGTVYQTTFEPGGRYTARMCPSSTPWVGSWVLKGRVLVIVETQDAEGVHGWMTWTIRLDRKLRRGRIAPPGEDLPREGVPAEGTPFRIEENVAPK